jgi:hypothetical protein
VRADDRERADEPVMRTQVPDRRARDHHQHGRAKRGEREQHARGHVQRRIREPQPADAQPVRVRGRDTHGAHTEPERPRRGREPRPADRQLEAVHGHTADGSHSRPPARKVQGPTLNGHGFHAS